MTALSDPAPFRTTRGRQSPGATLFPVVHASLWSRPHSPANRRQARALTWKWAATRWPRLVPGLGEIDADHMERALPGQALLVSTSPDGHTWSLAVAHGERQGNRTWTTEAVVRAIDGVDLLSVRTSCSDVGHAPPVIAPPRLLGTWVERMELDDGGVPVLAEPRLVNHPSQLEAFFDHVLSRERKLPVIALTSRPRSQHYGVDPRALAQAVRGVAHVSCIPGAMAGEVGRTLGPMFDLVHGAARVFAAGFHRDAPEREHPLLRARRERVDGKDSDPGAFRKTVCRTVCAMSVRAIDG